jgi:hypothetical protein
MFAKFKEQITNFIKENFSDVPPIEPATSDLKTADGATITVDKLEAGGVCTIEGAPAPDGEYILETGEAVTVVGGMITDVATKPVEDAEPKDPNEDPAAMKTPEQMKAALDKFATNPDNSPDMAKLVIIVKACFEYAFGWQIREEQERLQRQSAIEAYKTGFTELENKLKGFGTIISEFADIPTEPAKVIDWDSMTPLEKRRATK